MYNFVHDHCPSSRKGNGPLAICEWLYCFLLCPWHSPRRIWFYNTTGSVWDASLNPKFRTDLLLRLRMRVIFSLQNLLHPYTLTDFDNRFFPPGGIHHLPSCTLRVSLCNRWESDWMSTFLLSCLGNLHSENIFLRALLLKLTPPSHTHTFIDKCYHVIFLKFLMNHYPGKERAEKLKSLAHYNANME